MDAEVVVDIGCSDIERLFGEPGAVGQGRIDDEEDRGRSVARVERQLGDSIARRVIEGRKRKLVGRVPGPGGSRGGAGRTAVLHGDFPRFTRAAVQDIIGLAPNRQLPKHVRRQVGEGRVGGPWCGRHHRTNFVRGHGDLCRPGRELERWTAQLDLGLDRARALIVQKHGHAVARRFAHVGLEPARNRGTSAVLRICHQGLENAREGCRPPDREVGLAQLALLAQRRAVVVRGRRGIAPVAEVGAAVENVECIATAAKGDDLPRPARECIEIASAHLTEGQAVPAGPKLARVPGIRAIAEGRPTRRVAGVVQARIVERNVEPKRARLVVEMLEVGIAVGARPSGMLVLELHPDHAAALVDLVLGNDWDDLLVVGVRRGKVVRGGVANLHVLRGDPLRNPAGQPFGAVVRARPHDRVHADVLDGGQPGIEIEVVTELEDAGRGLLRVPKDIGRNGIEACALHLDQPLAPQLARHACVVDLAG